MAELSDLLHDHLVADSGVSALVGVRVYPVTLPDRATLPAITFRRVSGTPQFGSTRLRDARFQVDCWAATYGACMGVAVAVRAALEGEHTGDIIMIRVVNEIDDYEPDTRRFRRLIDALATAFE